METLSGNTANGVPFVARKAATSGAPLISAWHLMDPPNSPAAMAAALPLAGLDANVIYFGLPLTGPRSPADSFEVFLQSGADAVTDFFGPMLDQAVEEYPAAVSEVCQKLGVSPDAPLGFMGGSAGAGVAAAIAIQAKPKALALFNPMLKLRPMIEAWAEFGLVYEWSPASDAYAESIDFVARIGELAASKILVIDGAQDEAPFLNAVKEVEALNVAEVHFIDGVEHPLAEWPGDEPAPQIEAAKTYDKIAAEFFKRELLSA